MHLDFGVITGFIAAHSEWALPLAFLVSFAESVAFVSLVVPGTAILVACGALVPGGTLSFWPLMAGAVLGATLGDGLSYGLGWRYGQSINRMWPLSRYPGTVAMAEAFLRRHGVASVAIGRFFGPIRAVVPLAAGIVRMKGLHFWLANVVSALVWAPAVLAPGTLLGWAAEAASPEQRWLLAGVVLVAAVVAAVVVLRKRRSGQRVA